MNDPNVPTWLEDVDTGMRKARVLVGIRTSVSADTTIIIVRAFPKTKDTMILFSILFFEYICIYGTVNMDENNNENCVVAIFLIDHMR